MTRQHALVPLYAWGRMSEPLGFLNATVATTLLFTSAGLLLLLAVYQWRQRRNTVAAACTAAIAASVALVGIGSGSDNSWLQVAGSLGVIGALLALGLTQWRRSTGSH